MGVVASVLPPAEACRFLVDMANLRGGPDNITVLIVHRAQGRRDDGADDAGAAAAAFAAGAGALAAAGAGGERLLVAGAVGLKLGVPELTSLAYVLFVGAVGAIGAGVAGLVQHQKKQAREGAEEQHEPRVYTQKSCHLEPEMLEKLSRAAQLLKDRAAEKQWEPDLAAYDYHHKLAEQHLKDNDLAGAFRESCRAMRPLNAAMNKHRSKEEVFQPVWDKDR